MWTYSQSTGRLARDGAPVAAGYSGAGAGRNNPDMEAVRDTGPIPAGRYGIGPPYDTALHGPHVMALTPVGHTACGRTGFLIHGDNAAHAASHGCIILDHPTRCLVSGSGDRDLEVVH